MSGDEQDIAESFDHEMIGLEAESGEDIEVGFPPDHPVGIQFADADVTDESLEDRLAQEEPEVWEINSGGAAHAQRHDELIDALEDDDR
jgi:hypothetical protein